MRKGYILTALIMWFLAYASLMTNWGWNLFWSIFGFFTLIATWGLAVLGFWVFIVGLIKD